MKSTFLPKKMFKIFKKKPSAKQEINTKKKETNSKNEQNQATSHLVYENNSSPEYSANLVGSPHNTSNQNISDTPKTTINPQLFSKNDHQTNLENNVDNTIDKKQKLEITQQTEKKQFPKQDSWSQRLRQGLAKSRDKFNKSLASIVGRGQINEQLYEDLETVLLSSDMGIEATEFLLKDVRERVSFKGLKNINELKSCLKDALFDLIKPLEKPLLINDKDDKPFVIMMVGVNGAGKTTTIGKLTKHFQKEGNSVILAAGDTFRAAAKEQLLAWGKKNNVTVITQEKGDSAAVCYDTVEAAKARNKDIVLADTAGRLPSQLNLMEEIKKVKRVIKKSLPNAPHEIILVLDANIGQNTLNQVIAFDDALGLTGLIITKLDGTAKGGIIAALAKTRPIPIRYLGIGESVDDLRPFIASEFVEAFFAEN